MPPTKPTPQDSTPPEPPVIVETPGFETIDPTPGELGHQDPPTSPPPDPPPSLHSEPTSPKSSTTTPSSSPASSPEPGEAARVKAAARAQLTDILGSAFDLTGVAIHDRLTPGDNDCWLPSPGERDLVAGSLASIAVRHMPAGMAAASDLGDILTAGVGLAMYAINNLARTSRARAGAGFMGPSGPLGDEAVMDVDGGGESPPPSPFAPAAGT